MAFQSSYIEWQYSGRPLLADPGLSNWFLGVSASERFSASCNAQRNEQLRPSPVLRQHDDL